MTDLADRMEEASRGWEAAYLNIASALFAEAAREYRAALRRVEALEADLDQQAKLKWEAYDANKRQAAEIARLEAERAEQWRLRRERESERDVKSAVIGDLKEEIARLREANGILEDGLQEVGDDYPGSSCQEWCQHQVKMARAALEDRP